MMQRADLCPGAFCRRQVVQIQGILGLNRTAQITIATMGAGALLLALGIDPTLAVAVIVGVIVHIRGPVRIKGDSLVNHPETMTVSQRFCCLFHQPCARGPLVIRQRLHIHHHTGSIVMGLECLVADCFRPAVLKRLGGGLDAYIGINQ